MPRQLTWRRKLLDLAAVLVAFALGGALLVGYAAFRVWSVGQQDNRRPVDAIVVLGAAQYDGKPSPVLAARLDHAIELYKQGLAPWFVVTGGKLPGDKFTEAASERNYAVARGVPASAILAETTGGTTLESMRNVRAIFVQHGLRSALFVSDRSHMLRVLRMAADQGIDGWGSPAENSPSDTSDRLQGNSFMHELGGLAEYGFLEQEPALPPTAASSGS